MYVNVLVSIISTLESYGPVILVGDLNAHLSAPTNQQGDFLLESISNCNLIIASSDCIAKGPVIHFSKRSENNCGLHSSQQDLSVTQ